MTIAIGAGVVFFATFLSGVVGFASSLVSFPLLLLIGVPLEQVVVANLLIALFTRVVVLLRRHRDVNWRRVALLIGGSIPGMFLGIFVLGFVASYFIQLGAGVFIIFAAAVLVWRQRNSGSEMSGEKKSHSITVGAGLLGGFLGVTTSMNGVPPALLLTGKRVGARSIVADLAVYFIIGNLITLATLGLGDRLSTTEVLPLLVVWIPVGIAGALIGLRAGPRLPYKTFHKIALAVIFLAGIVCIGTAA